MDDKLTVEQLGAQAKAKYPAYAKFSDREIGEKIIAKYPVYQNRVKDFKSSITPTQPTKEPVSGAAGFGVGLLKGLGSTAKSVGSLLQGLGQRTLAAVTPYSLEEIRKQTGIASFKDGTPEEQRLTSALEAKNTSQKIGRGVEQVAEFFLPATKIAKAGKALDLVIDGYKLSRPLAATAKIAGTSVLEGLGAGAVSLAQTGDVKEAGQTALMAGGLSAPLKAAQLTLKGFPEYLYSKIFKTELNTLKNEFRAGTFAKLAQTDPEKYKQALEMGLIKNGQFNETLAKQALQRGLKGSLSTMTEKVIGDTLDLEIKAQKAMGNKTVSLTGVRLNNLVSTLNDIAEDYSKIGSGEIGDLAAEYASSISKGKGKISGKKLLELRRFMDGMRIKSSYAPSARLSLGQENMKYWSDFLRGKINDIDGMGPIMKDYSFNIKAFDSLAEAAKRSRNNGVLGLFDTIFLGTGNVLPAIGVRASRTPFALTNIAQTVNTLNNSTAAQALRAGGSGVVADTLNQ